MPLYIQGQGYSLGLSGEVLEVREKGSKVDEVRLVDLSHLCLFGNVQVTAQALKVLLQRGIPVLHLSYGGWLQGVTTPPLHKNIELRIRQFAAAADETRSLALAKTFVLGKLQNCRTLLRRNGGESTALAVRQLAEARREVLAAQTQATLLGVEGFAARVYFEAFPRLLKNDSAGTFDFKTRNRRPQKDPVNALLSYVYSLLVREVTVALVGVGFDPYLGFYHQPRYGRPSLALDLMEEWRPLLADSVVANLINNEELRAGDFISRAGALALTPDGRKRVIDAYERRLDQLITHPLFGYRVGYRRVIGLQARILSRNLLGEIPHYIPFTTR